MKDTSRGYMDILEELKECSEYHTKNGHPVMASLMKRAADEIEDLRLSMKEYALGEDI
jgi:hypothetical protein